MSTVVSFRPSTLLVTPRYFGLVAQGIIWLDFLMISTAAENRHTVVMVAFVNLLISASILSAIFRFGLAA